MGAASARRNMSRKKFINVIVRYDARLWHLHFGLASSQRLMTSASKNLELPQLLHDNLRKERDPVIVSLPPSDVVMSNKGLGLKYPQTVA